MNKLKELQYKCWKVSLTWDNEQWEIVAWLPDGQGCYFQGQDVGNVIEKSLAFITEVTQARANRVPS